MLRSGVPARWRFSRNGFLFQLRPLRCSDLVFDRDNITVVIRRGDLHGETENSDQEGRQVADRCAGNGVFPAGVRFCHRRGRHHGPAFGARTELGSVALKNAAERDVAVPLTLRGLTQALAAWPRSHNPPIRRVAMLSPFLNYNCDFKHIRVRSFILNGAPGRRVPGAPRVWRGFDRCFAAIPPYVAPAYSAANSTGGQIRTSLYRVGASFR